MTNKPCFLFISVTKKLDEMLNQSDSILPMQSVAEHNMNSQDYPLNG